MSPSDVLTLFPKMATVVREALVDNISEPGVSASGYGDEYIEFTGRDRVKLDGEFNLHVLAGLVTRAVLDKFSVLNSSDDDG